MKILATFATVAIAAAVPLAASAQTVRETIYDFRAGNAEPLRSISDIGRPVPNGVYGGLPPYEVLTIVRSMGFDPQSRPMLRGGVYIVRAIDDQDIPVRVIVDARSGRVVNVAERGPMRDNDDGPAVGDRVLSEGEAYPVPSQPVAGGEVYRERDYRGPDYRAPDDRAQDYRTQDYRAQNLAPRYRSSDASVYSPAPYAPSKTAQSAPQRPRVASRAPVASHAKAAAPMPGSRPAAVATAPAATTVPSATAPAASAAVTVPTAARTPKAEQGAKTEPSTTPKGSATQTAPASTIAQDASRHGTSIPAPVATHKDPPAATPPAAKPETPAAQPSGDPSLVPVAPLE